MIKMKIEMVPVTSEESMDEKYNEVKTEFQMLGKHDRLVMEAIVAFAKIAAVIGFDSSKNQEHNVAVAVSFLKSICEEACDIMPYIIRKMQPEESDHGLQ